MPFSLRALGVVATVPSFSLLFATFRANPFLSGVVRIQEDRGQTVISTAPYHLVRHPMYAGAARRRMIPFIWR
jgi:protein-S-isoprenylcysteine O-methyltransferase Ste14